MYEQSLLGSRYANIIPAHNIVCWMKRVCYKHIYVIELTTFRLVNCRNDNICTGKVAKILYRRFKDKLLEICEVFCLVGLLKQFNATLELMKTFRGGVSFVCLSLCILPHIVSNQGSMCMAINVFQEETHFCHIPESEAIHTLDEFALQSMLSQ